MREGRKRILLALVPLTILLGLIALNIVIYGADSIMGASQVSLLASAGVCLLISIGIYKIPWSTFEKAIKENFGGVSTAILILLLIGAISGTWMASGVVPAFIYYGLKIINPKVFLLTACLLCAIVSVITGSSWTTIATVGVALIGIGRAEGFSDAMTAGAIISGAYFGDKISPLSDTTVLASSFNKVELFTHIRYMMLTTVPSLIITLVIFTVMGIAHNGTEAAQMDVFSETLAASFHITPWLMIVPILTLIMIWKKVPALLVLAVSIFTAVVAALIFQPDIIASIGDKATGGSRSRIIFTGVVESIYNSITVDTGNADVNQLIASRGMLGMLNTIFLIMCSMCFGACMRASGMVEDLARLMSPLTRTRTGLVTSTVVTGTALNGIVSDQYLSIILTSNIYGDVYEKKGYESRLLSRSVEDSSTATSPLFPWSSCGMTQATILSVPTLAYAPFCFFNLISPLMSIIVAATGWKIVRSVPAPAQDLSPEP
ncbi:MAG: sodium:proton antiporter [Bacteroidales bacterium]|nr:sodium:proton antiporter [Bacteroidales bacterium]